MTAPARDRHVDLMLAFGIAMVVMGHRYQPDYLFFPAYTFHMALFFFVSGYLARVKEGPREKLRFLAHKTRTQLVGYFAWALFFGVVTWLLARVDIRLGYQIPSFDSGAAALQSLRDFLVVPFLDGHHYHLYAAAWFLLQLYLVHVLFQLVFWSRRRWYALAVMAAALPVTLWALELGLREYDDLRRTAVRSAFAFLFYVIGYVVRQEEGGLRRILLAPATLVIGFALVNVLAVQFGNIRYNIVLGNINNPRPWVPLATTLLIVLMVYQLAWHAAAVVSDGAFVLEVGRSTRAILIWHFTVLFAVNVIFYAAGWIGREALSDNWYAFRPQQTWLLYVVPALVVPVWIDRGLVRARAALAALRARAAPAAGAP